MIRPRGSLVAALFASLLCGGVARSEGAPHADVQPSSSSSDLVARASTELSSYTDSDSVSVVTPTIAGSIEDPVRQWSIKGRYLVDVVSAASVDIVSTASQRWQEVRHAGTLEGDAKVGDFKVGAVGAISSEPDYLSVNGGGRVGYDFAQKNVSALLGYSYGHDTIGRTGTPFDVFSRAVARHSLLGAVTLVANTSTIFALVGDAILESGDSSKPYRYVPMFSAHNAGAIPVGADVDTVNRLRLPARVLEQLPLSRDRFAITGRLAHRLRTSTLRLEERIYWDTWGLHASSTELRFVIDLGRRVSLWPRARFHTQSPVSFWQRTYVLQPGTFTVPALRTGDRELGPLRALTGGFGVTFNVGPRQDPSKWVLGVRGDVIWTKFLDDLFITDRVSGFGALSLETVFE